MKIQFKLAFGVAKGWVRFAKFVADDVGMRF
jgi:hypothetical protein